MRVASKSTSLTCDASAVVPSSGSGYGPYLGVGFAGLVLLGLVVVYYFHKKRNGVRLRRVMLCRARVPDLCAMCSVCVVQKARRRRTRLELAHTRQRERLLNEYERRFVRGVCLCTQRRAR